MRVTYNFHRHGPIQIDVSESALRQMIYTPYTVGGGANHYGFWKTLEGWCFQILSGTSIEILDASCTGTIRQRFGVFSVDALKPLPQYATTPIS